MKRNKQDLSNEMEEAMRHSPEYRIQELEKQVEVLKDHLKNICSLFNMDYTDLVLLDHLGPNK